MAKIAPIYRPKIELVSINLWMIKKYIEKRDALLLTANRITDFAITTKTTVSIYKIN